MLSTLISQLIETLWDKGPVGMIIAVALVGWVSAVYLFFKNRGKQKKTEPTTIDYVVDIKKLHDKYLSSITELNAKYNAMMMDLNEKRIEDMRELASDYNALASNTLSTLDRLIEQLGSRRPDLAKILPGDNDGTEPD
jgi:hypothetical protein